MDAPTLDRLCRVYRAFRSVGFSQPEAWRYANEYLTDQPTKAT